MKGDGASSQRSFWSPYTIFKKNEGKQQSITPSILDSHPLPPSLPPPQTRGILRDWTTEESPCVTNKSDLYIKTERFENRSSNMYERRELRNWSGSEPRRSCRTVGLWNSTVRMIAERVECPERREEGWESKHPNINPADPRGRSCRIKGQWSGSYGTQTKKKTITGSRWTTVPVSRFQESRSLSILQDQGAVIGIVWNSNKKKRIALDDSCGFKIQGLRSFRSCRIRRWRGSAASIDAKEMMTTNAIWGASKRGKKHGTEAERKWEEMILRDLFQRQELRVQLLQLGE